MLQFEALIDMLVDIEVYRLVDIGSVLLVVMFGWKDVKQLFKQPDHQCQTAWREHRWGGLRSAAGQLDLWDFTGSAADVLVPEMLGTSIHSATGCVVWQQTATSISLLVYANSEIQSCDYCPRSIIITVFLFGLLVGCVLGGAFLHEVCVPFACITFLHELQRLAL